MMHKKQFSNAYPSVSLIINKDATHHQVHLWGQSLGSALVMCGFYCNLHARASGSFGCRPELVVGLPSRSFHYTAALPRRWAGLQLFMQVALNRHRGPAALPTGGGCFYPGPAAGRPSPGACRCQGCASPPQKNSF